VCLSLCLSLLSLSLSLSRRVSCLRKWRPTGGLVWHVCVCICVSVCGRVSCVLYTRVYTCTQDWRMLKSAHLWQPLGRPKGA
jgi:hypothetical protein